MSPCQFSLTSILSLAHAQEVPPEPARVLNIVKAAWPQHHLIWICPREPLLPHQFWRPLEVGQELWAWYFPIPSQQVMGAVASPRAVTCLFCPLILSVRLRLPIWWLFVKKQLMSANHNNWAFCLFGCMLCDKMLKPPDSEQKHPQMFIDGFNVSIIIWTGLCFTMAEFPQLKQEPYYLLVNSGYVRFYQSSWSLVFRNLCSAEIWALIFINCCQQSSEPTFQSSQKLRFYLHGFPQVQSSHKISHGVWYTILWFLI